MWLDLFVDMSECVHKLSKRYMDGDLEVTSQILKDIIWYGCTRVLKVGMTSGQKKLLKKSNKERSNGTELCQTLPLDVKSRTISRRRSIGQVPRSSERFQKLWSMFVLENEQSILPWKGVWPACNCPSKSWFKHLSYTDLTSTNGRFWWWRRGSVKGHRWGTEFMGFLKNYITQAVPW